VTEAELTEKGLLVVVSGFSGAGKGSIMKRILQKYDNYALSISATTRDPRPGEMDGQDYFYKTQKQFEKMIDKDELIEYASYQGNYYGTPKAYVEKQLNSGRDVILEIEVQGATKVKELLPDTVLIFVTPPSAAELRDRLTKRATESADQIRGRLRRAVVEAEYMPTYDYILVNDDLEAAVTELDEIVRAEHKKSERNSAPIARMTTELKELLKGDETL
jgi:guanylate kinase